MKDSTSWAEDWWAPAWLDSAEAKRVMWKDALIPTACEPDSLPLAEPCHRQYPLVWTNLAEVELPDYLALGDAVVDKQPGGSIEVDRILAHTADEAWLADFAFELELHLPGADRVVGCMPRRQSKLVNLGKHRDFVRDHRTFCQELEKGSLAWEKLYASKKVDRAGCVSHRPATFACTYLEWRSKFLSGDEGMLGSLLWRPSLDGIQVQ